MGRASWDFRGEIALLTGGGGGIGHALARALAGAGARVHVLDACESPAPWTDLAPGQVPLFRRVDLRDRAATEAAVQAVLAAEGRVDLLVNNAGLTRDRALWNLTEDDWRDVLDVNLTAAWRVLKLCAPSMRARGSGCVLQIASINGLRGRFGQANYSSSKAGLIALTRTAARELGGRGIRVNALAPGMIETALSAGLPEDVRERSRAESALGRLGHPDDVVGAALFLLSESARHITGTVVVVDGGQSC